MWRLNPFIFIKNKRCVMSSEGFSAHEKRLDMFSEGNAADSVVYQAIQIVMALWRIFCEIELAGIGVATACCCLYWLFGALQI
jgi:hypothetical protein